MIQKNFSGPFIEATKSIFSTMLAAEVHAAESFKKETRGTLGCVTGIIGLAGDDAEGLLVVSFDESSILAITSTFYGEEYQEINQDALDTAGELTNIICGGGKAILSEQGLEINMASPTVIQGEKVSVSYNREAEVYVTQLTIPSGKFYLEVCIKVS